MPKPGPSISPGIGSGTKTDIGELTALFSAQSGGKLPTEVSADLALEIVLNEIVEQACLATGASGAAVLLERDGEMMCRASSGVNAPELGARVGGTGLTAQCIKTRQVQRCDDAQSDPRADVEASRILGVRSVMVLPLLRSDGLAGVLEVFSSRPGAFRERDELTLQTLAQQILKNMERANHPFATGELTPQKTPARSLAEHEVEEFARDLNPPILDHEVILQPEEPSPKPANRRLTLALSAAVLACSVLLAIVVGYRLGWRKIATERIATEKTAAEKNAAAIEPMGHSETRPPAVTVPAPGAGNRTSSTIGVATGEVAPGAKKDVSAGKPILPSSRSFPPEGGLAVYENGKEIFRVPPSGPGVAQPVNSAQKNAQPASAVVPAGIIELSPEVAAGSLLHRVEPTYPEAARQQGIQGAVVLDVRIGRDGTIQDVKVVSGQSLLADAAIAAVKQWRFKVRTQSGKPVEMQTRVTLNFRLPG
ncbi:MAG: TonB family protein [Candidatus Sulfotelmatobacter sp.]